MAKEAKTNPFKIVLQKHRVTYVHVKEPSKFEDDSTPKYDATFLIPYDHADVEKIQAVIDALYLANKESLFKGMPQTSPKLWNPLRDGAEWLEEHPEATEYEGHYFLKASSKSQPACFDEDGNDIIDLDEKIYSGAYCRGVIGGYAFNNKSKGMGFFLNSLKFMEDGERLGGFTASASDYDEDETPAPRKTPGGAKPAPRVAAKVTRLEDVDANDEPIYSDDNGKTWHYFE